MLPELDENEARIIGCLIEKSVVTPDQYPLTLNALTNACNQKSSRDPVMSLSPGEVQHTIRGLEAKHLVRTEENFKKYLQRFCNTRYSDYQFSEAERAVVTMLLLRGPQTPGELRAHSGRLHSFADNDEVLATLAGLMDREGGALVVKLPRVSGRKDSAYMHLFCGPVDVAAYEATSSQSSQRAGAGRLSIQDFAERIEQLEQEVAELKRRLDERGAREAE